MSITPQPNTPAFDTSCLPVETQYHLERLLSGQTTKQNVSRIKCGRKKAGNHLSAFNLGLAIYTYILITELKEATL